MGRLILGAFLLAVSAAGAASEELVRMLRQGGYVLYMRHASTDMSKNDARMAGYDDCANQRNLTDRGRDEARAVGRHVKRLGIPVGTVLASPFCRTMETAQLAFGRATATEEVRGGPVRTDDPKRYAALRELLSEKPHANMVISSHGNPFHAVAGPPYLAEGEIAVVRPEGEAKFTVVGRIKPGEWDALK